MSLAMNKPLCLLIAAFLASSAYAQTKPGELDPTGQGRPAARAEAKVKARPAGQVKAPGGDEPKTEEGGAIGTGRAAIAGDARAHTRDERRRNKDGSLKRRTTQGGTPQ